jgi:hypothetical protein
MKRQTRLDMRDLTYVAMILSDSRNMFVEILFHTTMDGAARLKSPTVSQNESQRSISTQQPVDANEGTSFDQDGHQGVSKNQYSLNRYLWWSFLTITAPLVFLTLFSFTS